MADKFNSRGVSSVSFQSFYGPPGDLGVGTEPLRESRYQNISAVTHATEVANGATPPRLGETWQTFDGRVYRYVSCATAVTEGMAIISAANVAAITNATFDAVATATEVTKTGGTFTINQYQGWYLTQKTGTGLAMSRRIVGNDATTFYLEDAFPQTSNATNTFEVWHPYAGDKSAAAVSQRAIGISIGTIGAANYGWVQTWGLCDNVIYDATVALGVNLILSGTNAGQVKIATAATEYLVGISACVGGSNLMGPAFLKIG